MRKVIFQIMISLDGFFEGPNQDISWHTVDPEFNAYSADLLSNIDTLVFGRVTYELMASYWPSDEVIKNDPQIAAPMNNLKKIVFSKTLNQVVWKNSTLIKSNPPEELKRLKSEPGKDIAIFGSSDVSLEFLKNNLIDELRIFVAPVILGKGKTLFRGIDYTLNLMLISTRAYTSGNMLLTYVPKT